MAGAFFVGKEPAQNQLPPQFNAEVIKQIDDAIKQRAMAVSGLSKEDVDSMNYFEDGDTRIQIWNHAKKLSESSVYNDIIANHIAQQHELQRMQYLQNKSVNDYNNSNSYVTTDLTAFKLFAKEIPTAEISAAYYVFKGASYDRLKNYGSVNCSTSQHVVIFKTPEQVVDLTYNKKPTTKKWRNNFVATSL